MSTPQSTDKLLISRGGVSYSITYSDINADAAQALTDAASAQATADAALPKAGGTMTGNITATNSGVIAAYVQSQVPSAGADSLWNVFDGRNKAGTITTAIDGTGTATFAGSLGVGTDSPSYNLCVEGSSPILDLYNTDATSNDSHSVTIQSYGPVSTYWNKMALNGSSIHLQTYGATRCSVTNDGLTFNGDTAAANALDDYEEGTWTPALDPLVGTFTGSYSEQTGQYTKIGNRVILSGRITLSSTGGTGTALMVSGLPFALSNDIDSGVVGDTQNFGSRLPTCFRANQSNNQLFLRAADGIQGVDNVDVADLTSSSSFMFSIVYKV